MSADQMTTSTEQTEAASNNRSAMDTSTDAVATEVEEKPVNGTDEDPNDTENKSSKRKRSTKKVVEPMESISTSRPKRNLSKREEAPSEIVNGNTKTNKAKVEQANGDADDEQERDKNLPVVHDVADVVWVKMGGHPWWPSLIIRDPNDLSGNFTKISGNARAKRMFFVVFYGPTADFAWISDAAVIAYQGVEAFTTYAQELVDKAVTKSQKEQLTERFQLKVTIGRREDWEMAVREADESLKQTSEKRLEDIEPKIVYYTNKLAPSKGQPGRRPKSSVTKPEEPLQPSALSTLDPADRSLLAEKTFEFKSDEEDSSPDTPLRKTPSLKIKLTKQVSNDSDSGPTPPTKRRYIRKSVPSDDKSGNTVSGQTANGSSVSYQSTTPMKSTTIDLVNGSSSGKKRGRPPLKPRSASSSNEENPTTEFHSASPTVTTKFTTQRKPIVKPQAFANSSGHDIRSGFLSPFEEQEVLDALEQLGSKTFEEAESRAKRRFEHILCLNLNRTHVDVPQEWFYTFLFSHPSLIMKNPQWFAEKNTLSDSDLLGDVQSSSSLAVLKHQLVVLSKLYRNELQVRPSSTTTKKRRSTGGKQEEEEDDDDDEELLD